MSARIAGLIAAVAVVVAGSAAIVLLVAGFGDDSTAFVDLEPGACFDLPDPDAGEGAIDLLAVAEIDCGEPHDAEVVAVGDLREGDEEYPGFEVADQMAAERCGLVDVDRAVVGVVPVTPAEPTWNEFAGRFVCLALRLGGGQLEGSVLAGDLLDG